MNIVFVSSEVEPFAKTGGLADIAGTLPGVVKKVSGCDIRVITPLYNMTRHKGFALKKTVAVKPHIFLYNIPPFDLYEYVRDGITTYFVERDEYFGRDELYATPEGAYEDNARRFSFFSKAVLAALNEIRFLPDVIHVNEWHSALVPFYMKFGIKGHNPFGSAKVLYTIHNLAYQGEFDRSVLRGISLPAESIKMEGLNHRGKVNLMKAGILYSDAVNTVSKGYAREIMTPEYGCGLEDVLRKRERGVYGILNGVDYASWDPASDPMIPARYDSMDITNKEVCKEKLLKKTGLSMPDNTPLFGVVTRLAEQKGIDLIIGVAPYIVKMGGCLVLLGTGREEYRRELESLAKEFPDNVSVRIAFDDPLAHLIEAGSDIFLMPSNYEPCGLNQIYSLKYGTIPVVRATGGLDDTVVDYTADAERGNGFKFNVFDVDDFLDAIFRAAAVFKNKKKWRALIRRAMECDFSWERSAKEYVELYERVRYRT